MPEQPVVPAVTIAPGCLTDVAGLRVGHHQRRSRGWRTGTTVVLAREGAVAGCDVRGGGPGTRETDLLRPEAMIEEVHAICLSGGSAFGLAAAGGAMSWLEERGIGFAVGPDADQVVPIVPSAVIFDLGRGGVFRNRPDASFGYRAAQRARRTTSPTGAIGAGTGALAGGLQGGVGTASIRLADGVVVAALAVVNAAGQVIDPATGLPWMHDGLALRRPPSWERAALGLYLRSLAPAPITASAADTGAGPGARAGSLNTTIGVVATSARLTKVECSKFADVAHDGMARAIRPVHSMFDGDTVFSVATGFDELPMAISPAFRAGRSRAAALNSVLEAGAHCFALACTSAVLDAVGDGGAPTYRDLCPGAFAARSRR
jgi:L-aminopeptidase/D-esterase-like protein